MQVAPRVALFCLSYQKSAKKDFSKKKNVKKQAQVHLQKNFVMELPNVGHTKVTKK